MNMESSYDKLSDLDNNDILQKQNCVPLNHYEMYIKNITEALEVNNSFRRSKILCDVTILTDDDVKIPAHKVILASASKVFLSMVTESSKKKEECFVSIKEIDSAILEIIIQYVYTFKLELTDDNVMSVIKAAHYLEIESIKDICSNFIKSNIDLKNCLYFLKISDELHCKSLYRVCYEYILTNFFKIKSSTLYDLTFDTNLKFISSSCLVAESEEKIFDFILNWVQFDETVRKEFIPKLMKHIRLPLVSKTFLFKVLNEPLVKIHYECLLLLVEAMMVHLAQSEDPTYINELLSLKGKRRIPLHLNESEVIICINDNDVGHEDVFYLDTSSPDSQWQKCNNRLLPPNAISKIVALENGVLLSIGGINSEDNITNEVFIFDISSYQRNWVQTTSMKFERMDFAVCTDQKCVYVIGGVGNNDKIWGNIECYDLNTKQWNLFSDALDTPRSDFSAIYHDNIIYIAGGKTSEDVALTEIKCYNVALKMWINDFCLLPQLINCSSITIFNNTLYVIGDLTLLEDFYLKVYAFDLKSGVEWKCLDSTKIKRLNPGVAVVNKKLFVVGGNHYCNNWTRHYSGDSDKYTSEIYDIEKNTWLNFGPTLNFGRKLYNKTYKPNIFVWSKIFIQSINLSK